MLYLQNSTKRAIRNGLRIAVVVKEASVVSCEEIFASQTQDSAEVNER